MNRLKILTFLPLPLMLTLGCGAGGENPGSMSNPGGSLSLILGSDSQNDWSQIVVGVEKVEISTDGTNWSAFAAPKKTCDLMSLQNGMGTMLVSKGSLSSGTYSVRVTWATTNYADGAHTQAYVIPIGSNTGSNMTMPTVTTFQGSVQVGSSGEAIGILMIDAGRAVQSYPKVGGGTEVFFQPHPELIPAATSGEIWGQVTSGSLAGAGQEVLAEIISGSLTPVVKRRAVTDANGNFVLGALPAGSQYFLVCMPSINTSFQAMALGPITPTAGGSVKGQSFAFSSGTSNATGNLQLTLTPASPKGITTYADIRQTFVLNGYSANLSVREGVVSTGATSDQRLFKGLPAGSFGANVTRLTTPVKTAPATEQSTVTSGTVTTTITIP